ncbi:MAG TPA: hypothetical protein VKD70_13035 [Candidatus Acidoferrum sp.]|nr:hypothetical protein [Candidatus Acidoferrum sp.]
MHFRVKRAIAVLTPLAILASSCPAFESPLGEKSIREAYFLGQHHDASTQSALKPYIHTLPAPQSGPHIDEIRLLTPYAQVIDNSNAQSAGYSAQQAAADYHAHADTVVVRFHIQFTPTYGQIESSRDYAGRTARKGLTLRLEDFWQSFKVGLSQKDQWLEPLSRDGEPIYVRNAEGGSALDGAYIWLTFDASEVSSDPADAEIFTPDGQHVITTFDLSALR